MPLLSPEDAVRQARQLLGLSENEEGAASYVRRLDKSAADYFLVHAAGHLVCLDAMTGELISKAKSSQSPVALTRDAAIRRTPFSVRAQAALVWSPSAASLSMFYPLWAISENAQTLYVDQRGKVWDTLPMKKPGGGAS